VKILSVRSTAISKGPSIRLPSVSSTYTIKSTTHPPSHSTVKSVFYPLASSSGFSIHTSPNLESSVINFATVKPIVSKLITSKNHLSDKVTNKIEVFNVGSETTSSIILSTSSSGLSAMSTDMTTTEKLTEHPLTSIEMVTSTSNGLDSISETSKSGLVTNRIKSSDSAIALSRISTSFGSGTSTASQYKPDLETTPAVGNTVDPVFDDLTTGSTEKVHQISLVEPDSILTTSPFESSDVKTSLDMTTYLTMSNLEEQVSQKGNLEFDGIGSQQMFKSGHQDQLLSEFESSS